METERRLHTLLLLTCNLFECNSACFLLACSDPALRHPLLAFLPSHLSLTATGPLSTLFQLPDALTLAEFTLLHTPPFSVHSLPHLNAHLALFPLESPSGLLGLLILADSHSFLDGELLLAFQFLSLLSPHLEMLLSDLPHSSSLPSLTSPQDQLTFLSIMNHELRIPLTAIKGYAGLLQAYGSSPSSPSSPSLPSSQQQLYLQAILEQTTLLETLLGDLLDLSHLQTNRLSLHCRPIDVTHLCQHVFWLVQQHLSQEQASLYQFSLHLPPQPLFALADPVRLQQVLMNLLQNAVKYSPRGGPIELFVSLSSPSQVSLSIQDSGLGIPLSLQSSLFRPFSRIPLPASSSINGSGLGLYISRLLIEAMGGSIRLLSYEGLGTHVILHLPHS